MGLGKLLMNATGGGSFGLIARNITYIHYQLSTAYAQRFPTYLEMYVTTGTIDTLDYLRRMQIFPQQIAASLQYVFDGQCALSDEAVTHSYPASPTVLPEALISFVMQMQCLIFRADKPSFTIDDILSAVVQTRPTTEQHVIATQTKCQRGAYRHSRWDSNISRFMNSNGYADIRQGIGILPHGTRTRPSPPIPKIQRKTVAHKAKPLPPPIPISKTQVIEYEEKHLNHLLKEVLPSLYAELEMALRQQGYPKAAAELAYFTIGIYDDFPDQVTIECGDRPAYASSRHTPPIGQLGELSYEVILQQGTVRISIRNNSISDILIADHPSLSHIIRVAKICGKVRFGKITPDSRILF